MYIMRYFPFAVLFLFWIKDFNLEKFIPGFVLVCASTACRFLYSSHFVLGVEHHGSLDCCMWVHCSSAIWVTVCFESTKLQYIPKSTFWPKWRNESTGLGTCLQKGAKFVYQRDLYELKFFFLTCPHRVKYLDYVFCII